MEHRDKTQESPEGFSMILALPLKLKPQVADEPLAVSAGWLPSPDVSVWLREARRILESNARAQVKFYPLALSSKNPQVSGTLILVLGSTHPLDKSFGPQVQRLGEEFPGVFVPIQSRLHPALTAEEQRRLFQWKVHFMHPVLGLTGFGDEDAVLPESLLTLPVPERMGWFAAVPGPPEPPPLKQITLVQEISLEELMAEEGGNISSERLDKNPKNGIPNLLDFTGSALGAAGGAMGLLGAGILKAFGGGKLADQMGQWSQRMLAELMDRRQKELNRLLDSFAKNPLEALKHAIPLTGAESRRGAAKNPGWQLGARSLFLNVSGQGSGPVDVWHIENDTRLKLERSYRAAAEKEASQGNWGRAAYIYGELLGDWNMAAMMLEKGGRPRDAARIYLDRMKSGVRAAQCLEKAGLLAEAIDLYRQAGMHEKTGDLLALLGQEEEARKQWRLALQHMGSPLDQARLFEEKLREVDRAIYVLDRAWPDSSEALACFEAEFDLLGRHGRHQEADSLLDRLERNPNTRLPVITAMVAGLHTVFKQYPTSQIRSRAAYLGLHFSGEFLALKPQGADAKKLRPLLSKFAPEDRLLGRDADRFNITHNRPAVPLLKRGSSTLRPVKVITLDASCHWQSLAADSEDLSAAGWTYHQSLKRNVLALCKVGGAVYTPPWPLIPDGQTPLRHLLYSRSKSIEVTHFLNNSTAVWHAAGNQIEKGSVLAIGNSTLPGEFLLLSRKETGALIAEFYDADGMIKRSRVLDHAPTSIDSDTWFTGGHGSDIWIAGPSVACCVNEAVEFKLVQLNAPVTSFAVSPEVLLSQAIAVSNSEAVLLTPAEKKNSTSVDCVNLYSGTAENPPVVVFTNDGRAIIADARGGVVYGLKNSCTKEADIFIPPDSGELLAASAIHARGFAFLTSKGTVLRFDDS